MAADTFIGACTKAKPACCAKCPPDTKPFLSDHFDVNAYANAILAGRIYDPEAPASAEGSGSGKTAKGRDAREAEKGDTSTELARLNYGIVSVHVPTSHCIASRLDLHRVDN